MAVAARTLHQTRRRGASSPRVAPAPARRSAAAARSRGPFALLAVTMVTALVVGLVSAQSLVAQGSFHLEELRQRTERVERQFGRLRLQADKLSALERIERAALKAGLVYPSEAYRPLQLPPTKAPVDARGAAPGVDAAADVKAALGAGG